MKLIPLIFFISIAVDVRSTEHFTFPPKFHPPSSGIMLTSDSSIYLPPESHTAIPYYPMKNANNLPFPYLPHTVTKAPIMHPTPYPIILSSTLLPINTDSSEDEDETQTHFYQKNNRTDISLSESIIKRDFRPRNMNYQPIDRIDLKVPFGFINNNAPIHNNQPVQKATPRSMTILADQQRSDALDQLKGATAYQGPQYFPAPNAPGVYISSTTETAVPILRLSNEMDLDGSFSYEALGADQTHYVQHSRMENTGTDKEEQVVEGSYSYVGDNGKTYTVHYVADSNGFRASGDHLPVAPPIPEIIQRAVQYNLAEEAKKPPNDKSWNEEKENELNESERYHRFAIPPPSRPLFTGKTPESFSFGFAQGAHNIQNSFVSADSTQNPIRTNNDFSQEQINGNSNSITNNGGIISPQITFLASQGAHVPSTNAQQSISRVFSSDRTSLPQLINYEADNKEPDQSERNKGLWRWQYGLNTNVNQTPEKNTISRSSGADDDVIINFGDMTPEQYTKMIRSQLEPNMQSIQNDQNTQIIEIENQNVYKEPNNGMKISRDMVNSDSTKMTVTTESSFYATQTPVWHKNDAYQYGNSYHSDTGVKQKQNSKDLNDSRLKLITQNNFVPQSQLITQSYDYEDSSYEPKTISSSSTFTPVPLSNSNYNNINLEETRKNLRSTPKIENEQRVSTTEASIKSSTTRNIKFSDFIAFENKNDFKPILPSQAEVKREESTTTETTVEDVLKNNVFLKNLLTMTKNSEYAGNKIREDKNHYQHKMNTERKAASKSINMNSETHNDIKRLPNKPFDAADIMKFITQKNHFESIKIKPKPMYDPNHYNKKNENRFIPMKHEYENLEDNDDEEENMDNNFSNHGTSYHPEELRGIIKNYKVLQRNNSGFNNGQVVEQLRRDLSPPPLKIFQSNLPPLGRAGPSMKSYLPPIYV